MVEPVDAETLATVARAMRANRDPQDTLSEIANKGLMSKLLGGAASGGAVGALGSRLVRGESAAEPFKHIWEHGANPETLQEAYKMLSKVPLAAKLTPAIGAGAGALAGVGSWMAGRQKRIQDALEAAHGLRREQQLGTASIMSSLPDNSKMKKEYAHNVMDTAHEPVPHAVLPGGK